MSAIVRTRGVIGGRPRIDGTRISPWYVWECVQSGRYPLEDYPTITAADISTSLRWCRRRVWWLRVRWWVVDACSWLVERLEPEVRPAPASDSTRDS